MTDFWTFIKTYWNTTDWHVLVEESSRLGEKHNNDFAHKLILAFLDYIEEKSKWAEHYGENSRRSRSSST